MILLCSMLACNRSLWKGRLRQKSWKSEIICGGQNLNDHAFLLCITIVLHGVVYTWNVKQPVGLVTVHCPINYLIFSTEYRVSILCIISLFQKRVVNLLECSSFHNGEM